MIVICILAIWGLHAGLGSTQSTPVSAQTPTQAPTQASSQLQADWPLGKGRINDSVQVSTLVGCQTQCFTSPFYTTYDKAKESCEDMDQSLMGLYVCVWGSSDVACLHDGDMVRTAQLALEDYCVDLGKASSFGFSTFAVTTAITLPLTTQPASASQTSASTASSPALTNTTSPSPTVVANGPSSTMTSSDGTESTSSILAAGPDIAATPTSTPNISKKGLSPNEKIGIGVGVGVGILLLIGIVAAFFFLVRRRKNRRNSGSNPYGQVRSSEKAALNDSNFHAESQDIHPTSSSAAPFLAGAGMHEQQDQREEEDHLAPRSQESEFQEPEHRSPAPLIIPPDRAQPSTSMSAYIQQAQVLHRSPTPMDDEPPSPVSPVSPVSAMGSRPASLHSQNRHHDLP